VKNPLFGYLAIFLISIVFTHVQMSDMTQLLGAKKRHSSIAYLFYDYTYDTEVDLWCIDRFQDFPVHDLLMNN
jgi:hypothetical protein